MATIADLLVKIGADTSEMKKEIAAAKRQLNNAFGKEFMSISNGAVHALEGIAVGIAAIGAASLKTATHLQTTQMAFKNLIKDGEKAANFTREMEDFAFDNPLDFNQITGLSREMLALGFNTEQIIPILQAAGDAAIGLGLGEAGVAKVTDAFKMMIATGEVSGKVMKSLAMNGIPAWEMLAEKLGTDVPTAMQRVSDKSVDVGTAMEALVEGMNKRFGGQMEEYNKTLEGGLAGMSDGVERALRHIGMKIEESLGLGEVMGNIGTVLGNFGKAVEKSGIIEAFNETVPTKYKLAIAGVATAITALAIPAFYAMYLAAAPIIATLGAAVAATAPFIAAFAAVAATLTAVVVYWDEFCNAINAGMQALGILIVGACDGFVEAFLWFGKGAAGAMEWMFDTIAGYCPEWLRSFNSMLDSAIESVRSWAREAIQWFQKVFEVKDEVTNGKGNTPPAPKEPKPEPKKANLFSNFKGLGLGGPDKKEKSSAAKKTDAEKALDAYIKKLVDSRNFAEELWKLQSQGAAMYARQLTLIGDKYVANQAAYTNATATINQEHENFLYTLKKERELAEQIVDNKLRAAALKSIEDRTAAEQKLYELKLKSAQLDLNQANVEQATKDVDDNHVNQYGDVYERMSQTENNSLNKNLETLKEQAEAGTITLEQYKKKYEELQTSHDKFQAKLQKAKDISNQIASSFTNSFMAFLEGTKTASEAFADFAKQVIMYIIQMIVQAAILKLIAPWINGMFGFSEGGLASLSPGGVLQKATGGRIVGPGTGTSDSIPAMLSNGEYVVTAAAVNKVGVPFLDMINAGVYPRFAKGGSVGGSGAGSQRVTIGYDKFKGDTNGNPNDNPVQNVTVNLQAMDAASFTTWLQHGGLKAIKQAMRNDERNFNGAYGTF